MSASFGGPQIMGFNHDACGYATAAAMAAAFGNLRWQVLGFFDFCVSNGRLIKLIRDLKFEPFGTKYNGSPAYGTRIKKAFEKRDDLLRLPKKPNT